MPVTNCMPSSGNGHRRYIVRAKTRRRGDEGENHQGAERCLRLRSSVAEGEGEEGAFRTLE